jgi:hypothetical protein
VTGKYQQALQRQQLAEFPPAPGTKQFVALRDSAFLLADRDYTLRIPKVQRHSIQRLEEPIDFSRRERRCPKIFPATTRSAFLAS